MSRTETALGIPYFAPEGLIAGIKSVNLSLNDGGDVYLADPLHRPRSVFVNSETILNTLSLVIDLNLPNLNQGSAELGIGKDGIELIVVARIPRLRRNQVLSRIKLVDIKESKITLHFKANENDFVVAANSGPVQLSVYLVVTQNSFAKIFFPPPPGTWLAGYGFSLQPPRESFRFSPVPLDLENASRLGIPMETFVFIDFQDEAASSPLCQLTDVNEALNLYVNAEILESLVGSTDAVSRAMLVSMIRSAAVTQMIYQLKMELTDDTSLSWDSIESKESVAWTIVNAVRPGHMQPDQFLNFVKNYPLKAIAFADQTLGISTAVKAVM